MVEPDGVSDDRAWESVAGQLLFGQHHQGTLAQTTCQNRRTLMTATTFDLEADLCSEFEVPLAQRFVTHRDTPFTQDFLHGS
jgi:hypothetical protein